MQSLHGYGPAAKGGFRLELSTTAVSPLSLDLSESTEMRLRRLITENPVVIFSRSACCMCHVMKRLLATVGAYPTVIELEEYEIAALGPGPVEGTSEAATRGGCVVPAIYIAGAWIGGLESLVALHLSNDLVPRLVEAGALRNEFLFR